MCTYISYERAQISGSRHFLRYLVLNSHELSASVFHSTCESLLAYDEFLAGIPLVDLTGHW